MNTTEVISEHRTVSIKGVRATLAVLEQGTINGAAQKLFTSQPALSRLVKVTEQCLGMPLFLRTGAGAVPSPEAGPVFDRFRKVVDQLKLAGREFAELHGTPGETSTLNRQITVRHLQVLAELSGHGTVTETARALGQTPTAVSRTLKDLNRILGEPLFIRHSGHLVPTDGGKLLVRHAKLILRELRYVRQDINVRAGNLTGLVTIGSTPLTRSYLLPQVVRNLTDVHPGLRFSIVEGPYASLLENLKFGDIDIVVGALRGPAPIANVQEFRLFSAGLSIIARHGHPLTKKETITIKDLQAFPWVVSPSGTPTRVHFEQIFLREGQTPPLPTVECSSSVVARELLIKTDMLTILTFDQIQFEGHVGVLERLPIALPETNRPIGYTIRSDTAVPAFLRAIIQELRRQSYGA